MATGEGRFMQPDNVIIATAAIIEIRNARTTNTGLSLTTRQAD
jgi:hypothetical protein